MAAANNESPDPLILLRTAICARQPLPIPSLDANPATQASTDVSLAQANYLIFNSQSPGSSNQHISIPLTQPTRFISAAGGQQPLDLRSVFFCYSNRDTPGTTYITLAQSLNEELRKAGKNETVTTLVFGERVDLNDWLAGNVGEEQSEFIRSVDANRQTQREATDAAAMVAGDKDVEMRDAAGVPDKAEQERLREIYAGERRTGDRNTMLRGSKIQDFSDMRKKYSVLFFSKGRSQPQQPQQHVPTLTNNPALRPPVKQTAPGRRPEPIILLSPSASSLLRMPNIKSFLEGGVYTDPTAAAAASTGANILHLTRTLPSISATKPLRFILVDDPSAFRPDYWDRLVAVFTTGQTWQFKNYKWQQPGELFSHALGVYVGWKGEVVPETVKGWGRGVMVAQIDKGTQRWRDREVVEEIWRGIEGRMRAMGWGREQR
ncbi:hypothetical protein M433DRAFT_153423 [Acidomyces richmondensis BFW]|nr:MAG: hypothetical protein FE78DRAFT_89064 [Acidomyces sp. 'richmondensis']KYG46407.1 hypothetical protein M433DRAFT_153423 [Acidomyces richmondensis BFW]